MSEQPKNTGQPRAPSGRWCTSLGAKVCECGAIILPQARQVGRFVERGWPESCHLCGKPVRGDE